MNIRFRDPRKRPRWFRPRLGQAAIADCDIIRPRDQDRTCTLIWPNVHAHLETMTIVLTTDDGKAALSEGAAQRLAPRRLSAGGRPQGSSLSFMQKQNLDPNNVALACSIRSPPAGHPTITILPPRSARRQRLADREMDQPGFAPQASVVVANEDGVAAAAESGKRAGDKNRAGAASEPQCRTVGRAVTGRSIRRRREPGSPSASTPSASAQPITASGWPSFYIEEMVGHSQCSRPRCKPCAGRRVRTPSDAQMIMTGRVRLGAVLSCGWTELRAAAREVRTSSAILEYISRPHLVTRSRWGSERRGSSFELIDWIGWTSAVRDRLPDWDYDDRRGAATRASGRQIRDGILFRQSREALWRFVDDADCHCPVD